MWKDKNVFVTGAAGFIGAALTARLAKAGANVVALVHRQAYACWAPRPALHATVISGDIRDANLMREIVAKYEIEYVFHLAASAIVRIAARDPMTTWEDNVMGTVSVLEAVRSIPGQVKQCIVASSDKAYGFSNVLPYHEDFKLNPKNSYDASKAAADLLAQSYATQYAL